MTLLVHLNICNICRTNGEAALSYKLPRLELAMQAQLNRRMPQGLCMESPLGRIGLQNAGQDVYQAGAEPGGADIVGLGDLAKQRG